LSAVPYTFGDNPEASRRLRLLAEVYEQDTHDLLHRAGSMYACREFQLAVDLGCGPGWSTRLVAATLNASRTVGLDASESYIAEARTNHPQLDFMKHDVLETPFPIPQPDFLFCRFLLTHLSSRRIALGAWAEAAAPKALLAIHETEKLQAEHPALVRYYEMVDLLQRHHGQQLNVGAALEDSLAGTGWAALHAESVVLEKSARDMAQLHLLNLRTWSRNEFAVDTFERGEVERLARNLQSIASGAENAGVVRNTAKRIIAERR
jgi:trans-aconitate methyltransferase